MGTISSGIGLVSGINTVELIDQLMAIEARPRTFVQDRITKLSAQKAAFGEITARLLSLKGTIGSFINQPVFGDRVATSSDESVLTATAGRSATPGTFAFSVDRLVSTHQLISRGFADPDTTPMGPGTITIESDRAKLERQVMLADLNAQTGVQRGRIQITDRSGASAVIDLGRAVTLDEAINAINNAAGINVTASVSGDSLQIVDNTGAVASDLIIANVGTTQTATSLGIAGASATGTLTGSQINRIADTTVLDGLNDGMGVRTVTGAADLTVTDHSGGTFDVTLDDAVTVGDVIEAINAAALAAGSTVTAEVGDDDVSIKVIDSSPYSGTELNVAAANGSQAAVDLGFVQADVDHDGVVVGDRLLAGMGSVLLKNLNGGTGVGYSFGMAPGALAPATPLADLFNGAGLTTSGNAASDLRVFSRDNPAASYSFDIESAVTVQDLMDAFDTNTGGRVTLSIEGNRIRATDNTGGPADFKIFDINTAQVGTELGINVNGAVDTILGVDTQPLGEATQELGPGQIAITNRSGMQSFIDLSSARTIDDIVNTINDAGAGVTASLNGAGNGLLITDTTGATASNLIIEDSVGTPATDLGIVTDPAGVDSDTVESADLEMRYVAENTRLESLNGGSGVSSGKFTITDSNGLSSEVDLTQGNEVTIADVIAEINSRPTAIVASLNTTGDGILLTDMGTGTVAMKVEEAGSTTAADLGILGQDTELTGIIDGSLEREITIADTDTLEDIVDAINASGAPAAATIINDGSTFSPYRVSITSTNSGAAGGLLIDDGGLGLDATTLVRPADAVVLFGSADPTQALMILSSTNTLADTVPDVTVDLLGTSDDVVNLTIARDDEGIVSTMQSFVDGFNAVMDRIGELDSYDSETEQRGVLFGDPTVSQTQRRLFNMITTRYTDVGSQFQSLSQVGITIGSGARLEFDEAQFRAALDNDPDAVANLFSLKTVESQAEVEIAPGVTIPATGPNVTAAGFGTALDELLEQLTDSIDGTLTRTGDNIDNQIELANNRIDALNVLLAAKRQRLEAQFVAMEGALAALQSQQSSLNSLSTLAASMGSRSSSSSLL